MSDHSLPLLVLGAGGHAKVLIEIFQLNQQKVIGIITPDLHIEDIFEGLNIIGDDTAIDKYDPTKILLINGTKRVIETSLAKGFVHTSL